MDEIPEAGGIGTWSPHMAIPVAAGDVVQVLVQGSIEEQQCQNVWYFRAQAADTDMLLHLLAEIAECMLALVPILAPSYRLERIKGKIVSPALGLEAEWIPEPTDTVQGADAGGGMPSFVSALISLKTTRPGRTGKGRIYIAGVPEEAADNSVLATSSQLWIALAAFCACMLDKFKPRDVVAEGNYEWGVMSRKLGGAKPPFAAAGFATVIEAHPKRELATTRSRKIGRGR